MTGDRSLFFLSLYIVLQTASEGCLHASGNVNTEDTFVDAIRVTENATSDMNISYKVTFPSDNRLVMHFRVAEKGSQPKPASKRCFLPAAKLIPNKQYVSLQDTYSSCSPSGSMTTCSGSQVFTYQTPRNLFVNFGYVCGEEKPINLHYEFCISSIISHECQSLTYDDTCSPHINASRVFFPNRFGHMSQAEALTNRRHLDVFPTLTEIKSQSQCYQHISRFLCISLYPKCLPDNRYEIPCKTMCENLFAGCKSELDLEGIIDCDNYPAGLPPSTQCIYDEVLCPTPQNITNGTLISSGTKLDDTAKYQCSSDLYLQGDDTLTCLPSGRWSSDPPTCETRTPPDFPVAVVIIANCTVLVVVMLGVLVYCEKRTGFLRKRCCCRKTPLDNNNYPLHRIPKVFISFSSNNCDDVHNFINDLRLHIPQCEYFTYHDDFLAGEAIVDCIRKGIWEESTAVIVFLTQDFIDSEWCQHEFDEAFRRQQEDKQFRLVIALNLNNADELKNVQENIKTYLTSHIHLLLHEQYFWEKLRRTLCV